MFAIFTHWLSALVVIGLFTASFWIVDLTYYSSEYKTASHQPKIFGVLLLILPVSLFLCGSVSMADYILD